MRANSIRETSLTYETRPDPPTDPPHTSGCFPRGAAVTLRIFILHAQRLKPLQGPAPGRRRRPDRGAAGARVVRRPAAAGRFRRPSRSPSRLPGRRRRGPAAAIEARPGPESSAGPPPRAGAGDRAGVLVIRRPAAASPGRRRRGPAAAIEARPGPESSAGPLPRAGAGDRAGVRVVRRPAAASPGRRRRGPAEAIEARPGPWLYASAAMPFILESIPSLLGPFFL